MELHIVHDLYENNFQLSTFNFQLKYKDSSFLFFKIMYNKHMKTF